MNRASAKALSAYLKQGTYEYLRREAAVIHIDGKRFTVHDQGDFVLVYFKDQVLTMGYQECYGFTAWLDTQRKAAEDQLVEEWTHTHRHTMMPS